ncbi:mucin-2-like [Sardina pilchardus]|uniref:mucin-2-like n=1 Tax=Sardina pilchardus TaxID=27697 RepID=UPI002E1346AF
MLQVSDGKKSPESWVLIVVLVLIVALVLAVALFLRYKHREKEKQDRSNIVIYHKTENLDPDGIYEEIEDIGPPPLPLTSRCNYINVDNAGDPTYYTIQSPPNLPDDTGLHLLSKKSHTQINTVYANAEAPTIPGVPTYSNIQSPTHTSADTHPKTGSDEINSTVSTVYTTAQCPSNPTRIPTPHTEQPDPTNPVNQEPKYTNEDTVTKTPHSPTHTSDDTDYSMVCSPTSTQISTVYVNAEQVANNFGPMGADKKVPSKPIDSQLFAKLETSYSGLSAVCIPPYTTHTALHTTPSILPSHENTDALYPNFQVPINTDSEHTHAPEPMTLADDPNMFPIHVSTNPSPDHIRTSNIQAFRGSSN